MTEDYDTPTDRVEEGYNVLAEKADSLEGDANPWSDSHFQQYYSWPAARQTLPDLADTRVLLAGCGRGDYAPWFVEHGATVVGVDASETAIHHARQRFGDQATFHHADLATPLSFLDAESFDLVFSNLVMSHLEEWTPVFKEFHRLLAPRGTLVVATIHPHYLRSGADIERYDGVVEVMNDWPGVEIPTFYRPMNAVVTSFIESDFRLTAFEEPKPRGVYEECQPERYRDAMQEPQLLVIRAEAI